jgi:L-amino acid N-acyltransferase YncA
MEKNDGQMIFRLAAPGDAAGILGIYAPYIRNTSITFETEVPELEQFADRIVHYLENWPWLVCEVDGMIAGYAYGSRYRERSGYQWCVECSVYIHDEFQHRGIARALYEKLFSILKQQGYRNVYAVINTPNEKSVAFHESCGFHFFAMYENVGWKLGKWKDVGWWRLVLNDFSDDPPPPVMLKDLGKDFFPRIGLRI